MHAVAKPFWGLTLQRVPPLQPDLPVPPHYHGFSFLCFLFLSNFLIFIPPPLPRKQPLEHVPLPTLAFFPPPFVIRPFHVHPAVRYLSPHLSFPLWPPSFPEASFFSGLPFHSFSEHIVIFSALFCSLPHIPSQLESKNPAPLSILTSLLQTSILFTPVLSTLVRDPRFLPVFFFLWFLQLLRACSTPFPSRIAGFSFSSTVTKFFLSTTAFS